MAGNAESVIVEADMSAFEFHEAAWDACQREEPPPDPSALSDRALYVVSRYGDRDLPAETQQVLEAEYRRRGFLPDVLERLLGMAMMAFLAISWFVIGWVLLAH